MKIYIRDNGGKTIDRYTAYIRNTPKRRKWLQQHYEAYEVTMIGFSADHSSPQGFCQFTSGVPGRHLGELVPIEQFPPEFQNYLTWCFTPDPEGNSYDSNIQY